MTKACSPIRKPAPAAMLPTPADARAALQGLKADLMARGDATDLFALERGDGLDALLGNLDQSVFGEPAYPSIEAKAAHLLYFVIKNHPFFRRQQAQRRVPVCGLPEPQRTPARPQTATRSSTTLVWPRWRCWWQRADPAQKETLIKLVMNMLAGGG
jgi:hypothetical protein